MRMPGADSARSRRVANASREKFQRLRWPERRKHEVARLEDRRQRGVSNEIVICTGGSSRCRCTQRMAKPTSNPNAMPPAATHMNRSVACSGEKVRVVNAAIANCSATKAVASFTRLSPSRIVWIWQCQFARDYCERCYGGKQKDDGFGLMHAKSIRH